ncbi:MAG: acyl-CoA dehydrogenase family protein [Acidimicrobiales bacterium]
MGPPASPPPGLPSEEAGRLGPSYLPELAPLARSGLLDLPRPAGGRTWRRWQCLAAWARADLSLARIVEGHTDAAAVLSDLGRAELVRGKLLGVWAAGGRSGLGASRDAGGWSLSGTKRWCSGARLLDAALVSAHAEDGDRLFFVDLDRPGVRPQPGSWPALGMAASDSLDVGFDEVALDTTRAVGAPGGYLDRPGFWHGSAGVAACWLGGAEAVARPLLDLPEPSEDDHRLAHLGSVAASLASMQAMLQSAAARFDADPKDRAGQAERTARIVREVVEAAATDVLQRVGRATGAELLCHDSDHARRVADLGVYLRQSHAESDQARLGRLVAQERGRAEHRGGKDPG